MGLLSTIRSRCFRYDMAPVSPDQGLAVLKERFPGRSDDELKTAVSRCDGILGQAISLLEGDTVTDDNVRAALTDLVRALAKPEELTLMEWSVRYQLKKPSKQQLTAFYRNWNDFVLSELTARNKKTALTSAQLLASQTLARQGLAALDFNVAAAHSIGWFAAELWEIAEKA